ncbi:MAG: RluA family pseudouridine synthase [Planctomycetes bacterium]|nr:RluA family pseudouridine synthase [Planctomycetota bacterium]
MPEQLKAFKAPPKKFQPKGMTILYEDHHIIVIDKVSGLLTMGTDKDKVNTAYYLLTDYVRRGNPKAKNRIFIVHRLDKDTSGLLVFAKTEAAKRFLQSELDNFNKRYFAVVHGFLEEKTGLIESYLAERKDGTFRMESVDDKRRGKLSKTQYRVMRESKKNSLVEVKLLTGRKNQIRVHFAEKGHPVLGDRLYGGLVKGKTKLSLHSAYMSIVHPVTKKKMTFDSKIPSYLMAPFLTPDEISANKMKN